MSVAREMRPAVSASGGEYCAVPTTWVRTKLRCPPGSSLLQWGGRQGGVEAAAGKAEGGRCNRTYCHALPVAQPSGMRTRPCTGKS